MKKILAAILAITTIASMSVTAFAATTPVYEETFLVEDLKTGDDEHFAPDAVIAPDSTVYLMIGDAEGAKLWDTDLFKVKFDKGDNSKMIKKISLTEKVLKSDRKYCIKIELADDMTDKEYKLDPTVTFTAKDTVSVDTYNFASGDKAVFNFKFWVSNEGKTGDYDWDAGTGGYIAKPEKNDDNTVTWQNANYTIAQLEFAADSDVNKYYPKLSTKWDNADYANFDGDAFMFNFVGNPAISATSRPVLTLYNPFTNDDDEYTVDVEDLIVYEVFDGELVDVTAKFTATTNDDGDEVLTTKTRTLGTYIVTETAVVDDVTEEAPAAPVTDDGAVKTVPNTGR